MSMPRILFAFLLSVSLVSARPAAAQEERLRPWPADNGIFGAMRAEMDRSMKGLKKGDFGPPYFTAYRLIEQRGVDINATLGALLGEDIGSLSNLYLELRVGDRTFDNTDLQFRGWRGGTAVESDALRHALWRLTDEAYKYAASAYLRKKARRATEFVQDKLDDFSEESSQKEMSPSTGPRFDQESAKTLVLRLSRVFRRHPKIIDSWVGVHLNQRRRYLLTSEGTRLATDDNHVPGNLRAGAIARADDGMKIYAQRTWSFRTLKDLPSEADLLKDIEALARETEALRRAPLQSPLSAPALLDPIFAGVLFHEAIGHKLEGQRQRDPNQSQVFKDRIGKKVMPEFLSLIDDPTLSSFGGVPLGGHYLYDTEGVRARRVVLIEKGILRNFLMSRWPVKDAPHSNGHGRSDPYSRPTGRMSNLIVKAHAPVPRKELLERLRALTRKSGKKYGFFLTGSFGGENPNSRKSPQTLEVQPRLVYRVNARTGRMTLVRGVKMVGTPLGVLNRIVAAGDDDAASVGFVCGAESGRVPVSQTSPSILISEIELQRLPEDRFVPPLLPSPIGKNGKIRGGR